MQIADTKTCRPVVQDKKKFSCLASNFSFSIAYWTRSQAGHWPTKSIKSKLTRAQAKQNLRATCPKGKLGVQGFFRNMKQLIIMGFRAKTAYFGPIFISFFFFCRIELIFGRLTCFDMKSIVFFAPFSRNIVCKKNLSFPRAFSGDLLLNEKQNKPFVSLNDEVAKAWHLPQVVRTDASFIIHIITLIYCGFTIRAQETRRWTGRIWVCLFVTPVRHEVGAFVFTVCL